MPRHRKVILVGHCVPDCHLLHTAIRRAVPHAEVVHANDERHLNEYMTEDSLLLINRVLDGSFAFDSGLALIEQFAHRDKKPAMMLISNYADAQDHAVAAGAMRGFGKSQLYSDSTAELLRQAIPMQVQEGRS